MKLKTLRLIPLLAVLALIAGFAATSLTSAPQVASANDECGCDVTFTKWLTVFPNMSGTIGGDVMGSYQGIILNAPDLTRPVTVIEAMYNFNTSGLHSFSARVTVTQDNEKGTATITGNVVDGWMKGGKVEGQYKVVPNCSWAAPAKAPANRCFQGSLHLSAAR